MHMMMRYNVNCNVKPHFQEAILKLFITNKDILTYYFRNFIFRILLLLHASLSPTIEIGQL